MMTDSETTIARLKQFVQTFVDEREWQPFHDPKNLSMSIAIEAAELMEHFQWWRSDQLQKVQANSAVMAQVAEELADVFCYLLAFADTLNIDLAQALEEKMVKNRKKYPADQYRGQF